MSRWIPFSPFVRQCIVSTGTSVNMAAVTFVMAYSPGLALQLREPDSEISIDKSIESWIAAVPPTAGILGCVLTAVTMACFGRWVSQIASIVALIIGWAAIIFARSVTVILIGRFFQGLSMGSSVLLSPILIGEYCSPKYRGAFQMITGVLSAVYVVLTHTTALYLHWRTNATIGIIIAILNLPVGIISPESPSWLATKQRYEDCRRAFKWLRGDDEDEELAKLIKSAAVSQKIKLEHLKLESDVSLKKKMMEWTNVIKRKEFYKPILISIHVYGVGQWAGSHLFNNYIFDLLDNLAGLGYHEHALGLNIHRVLGSILSVYVITKTKRRTMFLGLSFANVFLLLVIAGYSFGKSSGVLPYDSPIIGLVLLHIFMFCIATCTLPLPYTVGAEVFPLKYKSISSGFCLMFLLLNTSIYVKIFPYLFSSIHLYGAFIIYAAVVTYCLVICYIYLPETKDRTLQDIEEEMIGKPILKDDFKAVQLLIRPVEKDLK